MNAMSADKFVSRPWLLMDINLLIYRLNFNFSLGLTAQLFPSGKTF